MNYSLAEGQEDIDGVQTMWQCPHVLGAAEL